MMENYFAYHNPQGLSQGLSKHMYVCAPSEQVATEMVKLVMQTNDFHVRAITEKDTGHEHFKDYFQNRQGYADTLALLNISEDIYKHKFIHYKTRQEKIDLLLSYP